MAQKKNHEVDAFLNRPNSAFPLVLIYGPDRGLVAERAVHYAKSTKLALDDPFSVIRLDADVIGADPSRLTDEVHTISMFGGERLIWIRNAGTQKGLAEAVKSLIESGFEATFVLIEAGDLKKGVSLRTSVENAALGMALPCYSDDGRGLDTMIDQVLGRENMQISFDARQLLHQSLGGDRLATRTELEKLCLYALGKKTIDSDDVRAAVGDVSAQSLDEIVDAVLLGDLSKLDAFFERAIRAGTAGFLVLNALARQFQQLQSMRYIMESERKSAAAVVAAAKPPVFYARRKVVETALSRWNMEQCGSALERIQNAVLSSRKNTALAAPLIRQTLLAIAVESLKAGRNTKTR